MDYDIEALDAYARACPSPHYLAFLDAISPWTAPDWVFETVERLPEMDTIDEYTVTVEKHVQENGTPSFSFTEGSTTGVDVVHYQVYRCNEDTGMTVSLGVFPPYVDDNVYFVDAPVWPTVEGELCHVEVTSMGRNGYSEYLLNVPIQIGSEVWYLRCSYSVEAEAYTVYGLWEGFDSDSTLFNRNVKQLSQMAGQQYRLLYPVDGIEDGRTRYESSQKLTMYRLLRFTVPFPLLPAFFSTERYVMTPATDAVVLCLMSLCMLSLFHQLLRLRGGEAPGFVKHLSGHINQYYCVSYVFFTPMGTLLMALQGELMPGTVLPLLYGLFVLVACFFIIEWNDKRAHFGIANLQGTKRAVVYAAIWIATVAIVIYVYPQVEEYATFWNAYLLGG